MLKLNKTTIQDLEQGRSMVEMLGVLAIIGVLSVAGIAGYNTAMNKYKANELLNEASKRAVVVAGQLLTQDKGNLAEFINNKFSEAEFKQTEIILDDKTKQFTIEISGVGIEICQQMQNMKGNMVQKFEPEDCETSATVKLTYNYDLGQENSSSEPDSLNENRGMDGTCLAGWGGENCDEACDATKPLISVTGACYPCDTSEEVYTTQEECDKCVDRTYKSGICSLPVTSCEGGLMVGKNCYFCEDPSAIQTTYLDPKTRRTYFDTDKCNECSEYREQYGSMYCSLKICPSDKPVRDFKGGCHSCDDLIGFSMKTVSDCTNLCSERQVFNGEYCSLKNCPEGYYTNGIHCIPCDSIYIKTLFSVPEENDCLEKCGDKRYIHEKGSSLYCLPKTCPFGYFKRAADSGFGCSECTNSSGIVVDSSDDCAACDDTISPREYDSGTKKCSLKTK